MNVNNRQLKRCMASTNIYQSVSAMSTGVYQDVRGVFVWGRNKEKKKTYGLPSDLNISDKSSEEILVFCALTIASCSLSSFSCSGVVAL
jgi:hypothetical protein